MEPLMTKVIHNVSSDFLIGYSAVRIRRMILTHSVKITQDSKSCIPGPLYGWLRLNAEPVC